MWSIGTQKPNATTVVVPPFSFASSAGDGGSLFHAGREADQRNEANDNRKSIHSMTPEQTN
jgi:hypothetical protein